MKKLLRSILSGLILGIMLQQSHLSLSVDSIVDSHYKRFMDIAKQCGVVVNSPELRIEIDYLHPNKPYYAVTYIMRNLISINYRKYLWLSDSQQEQVILHELGHALLYSDHDDEGLNLMNTAGFIDQKDYEENYDYYIRRLFEDCTKKEKFIHE